MKEGRSAYILSRKDLWSLTEPVKQCCSEDETEYEDDDHRKICRIRKLEWRNPELELIFRAVDKARARTNTIKAPPGQRPRIRVRREDNPNSDREAPKKLPRECYCPQYLSGLEDWELEELEIVEKPFLEKLKSMMANGLLPHP